MKHIKHTIIMIFLGLMALAILPACNQPQESNKTIPQEVVPVIDLNAETTELLRLQAVVQEAHLTEQPALLVHMLNDTFCNIKNGEVKYYTHDEMTDRFVKYFYSVEFIKWADIKPPVITISPDGEMAHVLIQKEVELILSEADKPTRERTEYAWTELWKKNPDVSGGKWKLFTITSTDKGSLIN